MQKPGYSLVSSKHYAMETLGFPRGGCQQQSKGQVSVKRQRQGKRQTLVLDLRPILERHHRLTLAA